MAESKAAKKVVGDEAIPVKEEKETSKKESPTTKDEKVFKDTDTFKVKSLVPNIHYTCPKTQDYFIWYEIGDEEVLTYSQLKTLKNRHIGFFAKKWLLVEDGDAMKKLGLDKYFSEKVSAKDFSLLYGDNVEAVERKIAFLDGDEREKFAKKVVDGVKSGNIANVKMIRALEKAFDIDLMSLV